MNLKNWLAGLPGSGKPMPVLSFPSVQLLGVSVYELTHNSELQAKGMKAVADRVNSAASRMMDLSVEGLRLQNKSHRKRNPDGCRHTYHR